MNDASSGANWQWTGLFRFTPAGAIDCEGSWSPCTSDCTRSYSVQTAAQYGGQQAAVASIRAHQGQEMGAVLRVLHTRHRRVSLQPFRQRKGIGIQLRHPLVNVAA